MAAYIPDIRHNYDFDSTIDPPYLAEEPIHYEFTIIFRLYLEQINPPKGKRSFLAPDHNGQRWPAIAWNNAAWLRFKTVYIEQVLKVWDKAFLLAPPAKYDGFVWPAGGRRRKLLCRLRVKIQDSYKNAHAGIRVVRLAAPSESAFRSNSGLYDSGDVIPSRHSYAPEGASFLHNTPAHEMGHLLGLWDIGAGDEACTDEGSACYGSNLNDRMNVMGSGSMLDLANALPWIMRIPQHAESTSRSEWTAEWASSEAQLRGLESLKVAESHKKPYKAPQPGIIDL